MNFWIREASGKTHDGVCIQGNGGTVRGQHAKTRLQTSIDRATEGRDTGLYEPAPGHVLGFYENAVGRYGERQIDLRGATIVRAEG